MTGPLQYRIEGNASHTHDSSPDEPAHDEGTQPMPGGSGYDPGPSFVESDRPTDRLTEMPAWLQTFAAQQSERAEALDAAPSDVTSASDESMIIEDPSPDSTSFDPSLPDWLQAEGNDPEGQQSAPGSDLDSFPTNSPGEDSFISEDDLPDWLRAFSEEVAEAPASGLAGVVRGAVGPLSSTHAIGVRVPPVENVWLSTYERQALGPGATLFALLAANPATTGERDAQPYGATQAEPSSGTARGRSHAAGIPADSSAERDAEERRAARDPASRRWLLLTLLLVTIVILISVWQFS